MLCFPARHPRYAPDDCGVGWQSEALAHEHASSIRYVRPKRLRVDSVVYRKYAAAGHVAKLRVTIRSEVRYPDDGVGLVQAPLHQTRRLLRINRGVRVNQ